MQTMKTTLLLLILLTVFSLNTFAQEILWDGDPVYSVAFSPDGRTLAIGASLWDVSTGNLLLTFTDARVFSVAFSPDGNILATGSSDGTKLWEISTGNSLHILDDARFYYSVAFSPDGNTLATGSREDGTIKLWEVSTGNLLHTFRSIDVIWGSGPAYVESVAFSPDGRTIASGGSDGAKLWEVSTGNLLLTFPHPDAGRTQVNSVAFSPDGRTIATGTHDDGTNLWDATSGAFVAGTNRRIVLSVAFSPDGNTLASGYGHSYWGGAELWAVPATRVQITPNPVASPPIGEHFTINVSIAAGANVGGYQLTVWFDSSVLRYVESTNGDYLPPGAFFVPPVVSESEVTLGATSLSGLSNGDGTLATVTFEVLDVKKSVIQPFDVILLTNADEEHLPLRAYAGKVVEPPYLLGDVNRDGVVNILDLVQVASKFGQQISGDPADVNEDGVVNIVDLVKVAGALGNAAAAPSVWSLDLARILTREQVQQWLSEAEQFNLTDATAQRGIVYLEQLLAALTPEETILLPNYPNPFNPETWIPYQLTHDAEVSLSIYNTNGVVIRVMNLGHQPAGFYTERSRAAYWDGRNNSGETVSSGVYFYRLRAGDYSHMRRMVIVK